MSSPSLRKTPPVSSDTATTRVPASCRKRAACDPTLPKPWTAALTSSSWTPASPSAAAAACTTPRDVAVARPSEPPTATGLPVVTPGIV